jgi:hypothetical protein
MKQEAINQKNQAKKYPCKVEKLRRAKGCKEKTISHSRNKNRWDEVTKYENIHPNWDT